jgi:hypothetical protein
LARPREGVIARRYPHAYDPRSHPGVRSVSPIRRIHRSPSAAHVYAQEGSNFFVYRLF